jgi:hypothetical protein
LGKGITEDQKQIFIDFWVKVCDCLLSSDYKVVRFLFEKPNKDSWLFCNNVFNKVKSANPNSYTSWEEDSYNYREISLGKGIKKI